MSILRKRKVIIFGTFDLIHPGHLYLFNQAKKYGQVHACLALDETIRKVKNHPPHYSIKERKRNLEPYGIIAHCGSKDDKLSLFKDLLPDTVVLGYDQRLYVDTLNSYIQKYKLPTQIIRLKEYKAHVFKSTKLLRATNDPDGGFLFIKKPTGESSFRTISQLRHITGIKRIGFAGTLDPLASGLLICGFGSATKLIDWWHIYPKRYVAKAKFGYISDTYDSDGVQKKVSEVRVTQRTVEKTIKKFKGTIIQLPPMFSAKKVDGQRLYKLAREGKSIERKKQTVTVYDIQLESFKFPLWKVSVRCSSGVYVRTLIHDIGQELRTGAVLTALERTAIGPVRLLSAYTIKQITHRNFRKKFYSVEEFRQDMNEYTQKTLKA